MHVDKFVGNGGSSGGGEQFSTAVRMSTAGLVHKAGDTMLGAISMGGFRLTNVGVRMVGMDAATKSYTDTVNLQLSGGTMTGDINMGNHRVRDLSDPVNPQDAATKIYVKSFSYLCYDGHIPPMSQESSQTGFRVTASSFYNELQQPYMAFAPKLPSSPGKNK